MTTAEQYAASVGEWATGAEAYGLTTVDVPAEHWIEALTNARDVLGLAYFDWLSAVDELADGFSVVAHLAAVEAPGVRHLTVRTRLPRDGAALPTAVSVYAGAAWHERETHEMFGIDFPGHPHLAALLLPDGFEGHPLRKEFVLAARVAKAWPGAKEPGESDHGEGPVRRKMQPAGVPDPNEWGPLKGTLPPVAERPARGARAAGAAARTPRAAAAAGGAAAGAAGGGAGAAAEGAPVRADRPRRTRSVSEGSASQAAPTAEGASAVAGPPAADGPAPAGGPSPAESTPLAGDTPPAGGAPAAGAAPAVGEGAPAVRADRPRRTRTAADGSVGQTADAPKTERPGPARPSSSDAPWHNPVPAHDDEPSGGKTAEEPGEPEQKDETPADPADRDGDGA
ncbi:NADH-quinone oxidoreductase subunit C [Streptomyces sp. NRRL S-350]|uniref:NADH-quinone oxidoreductase subunit C n=1 Tax=Streptomyces sp. NRRL S-350 TaxID=1463902 RepID=UPI00068DFCCD|nr:NADH-quinone oxidoreductase subunit C [Streptomyces sp. NRRL S-350]